MRVATIAGHALLEFVCGQVVHDLGEDGTAEVHSTILRFALGPAQAAKSSRLDFKSKNPRSRLSIGFYALYAFPEKFSRTLVSQSQSTRGKREAFLAVLSLYVTILP